MTNNYSAIKRALLFTTIIAIASSAYAAPPDQVIETTNVFENGIQEELHGENEPPFIAPTDPWSTKHNVFVVPLTENGQQCWEHYMNEWWEHDFTDDQFLDLTGYLTRMCGKDYPPFSKVEGYGFVCLMDLNDNGELDGFPGEKTLVPEIYISPNELFDIASHATPEIIKQVVDIGNQYFGDQCWVVGDSAIEIRIPYGSNAGALLGISGIDCMTPTEYEDAINALQPGPLMAGEVRYVPWGSAEFPEELRP